MAGASITAGALPEFSTRLVLMRKIWKFIPVETAI